MRIDAHQHFFNLQKFDYPWMPPEPSPVRQDLGPDLLARILKRNRFDGSVVVQALQIPGETQWLLELASHHDFILGVVGWADLTDSRLGGTLHGLQRHPKFKGIRHPVQNQLDTKWLLGPEGLRGLRELAARRLPFDLLVRPPHLPLIPRLADAVPDLPLVIDHLGKPRIAEGDFEPWANEMERIGGIPHVCVKLSGMITEAGPGWKAAMLAPYVRHALNVFGPQRLMFGSDWPVCLLAADTWKKVLAAFTQALGAQTMETRSLLLGDTAQRFYRL